MKKVRKLLCLCLAITILGTACGKTDEIPTENTLIPEIVDVMPDESSLTTMTNPSSDTTSGETESDVMVSRDDSIEVTTTEEETEATTSETENPFADLFGDDETTEATTQQTTVQQTVTTIQETTAVVSSEAPVVTTQDTISSVPAEEASPVINLQDMTAILDTSNASKSVFYNQLSEDEQAVYNKILASAIKFKGEVKFDEPVSTGTYKKMFCLVNYQNPEVFWLSNKIMYDSDTNTGTLMYLYDKEQAKSYQAYLNKRTSSLFKNITDDMTDLQKVIICHNWICVNNVFSKETEDSKNAYGSLAAGVAQCEGYAKGMLYLMNKVGIPCVLMTGYNEKDATHAWVKVQINGEWTNVDVTFDDTVMDNPVDYQNVSYKYLCVPDVAIYGVTHKEVNCYPGYPDIKLFQEPEATTYSLNADINYGNYAETYEEAYEILKADCFKAVSQGRRCAHVKIGSDAAYAEALERMIDGKEVLNIKKAINEEYGKGYIANVAINPSNKLNYLEITIYYGGVNTEGET